MTQVHNSKTASKIEIRRRILADVPSPHRVLELYAGPGVMRAGVYAEAERVAGIDIDPRSVADYLGAAERVVQRIDLNGFNVFDADHFGSPWEAVYHLGRRRRPRSSEVIAVFVTDGASGGPARMCPTFARRGWSRQMCDAVGVRPDERPAGIVTGKRNVERTTRQLLAAFFPGWELRRVVFAYGGGSGGTLYAGAVLAAKSAP